MKIETWNKLIKPLEVDTEAVDGDIVDYIDNLYCLCQCERNGIKDANNIVVLAYEYNLKHIKAMFKFIVKLYDKGIRYIRWRHIILHIFRNKSAYWWWNRDRDYHCPFDRRH